MTDHARRWFVPLWYSFSIILRALREGYERQTIGLGLVSGTDTVGGATDHGSVDQGTHRTPAVPHRHPGKTRGATGEFGSPRHGACSAVANRPPAPSAPT